MSMQMYLVLAVLGMLCLVRCELPQSDCVAFVRDVTIADGTELKVGSEVTKTWRVRNCGLSTWKDRILVVRYGASPTGTTAKSALLSIGNVPMLKPGEEGDVSIKLRIPPEVGSWSLFFDIAKKQETRDPLWVIWSVS